MELSMQQLSERREGRLCGQAVVSFAAGVLGLPVFLATLWLLKELDAGTAVMMPLLVALLVIPALEGVVLGWLAVDRIRESNGKLRGLWMARVGAVLAAAWPVAVIWVAVPHLLQ